MNELKLKMLFGAARRERAPEPGAGFETRVRQAIEREGCLEPLGWFDQLGEWWPRLAAGAALMIGLCVVADVCLSALGPADLSAGLAEVSEQWLFAVN